MRWRSGIGGVGGGLGAQHLADGRGAAGLRAECAAHAHASSSCTIARLAPWLRTVAHGVPFTCVVDVIGDWGMGGASPTPTPPPG